MGILDERLELREVGGIKVTFTRRPRHGECDFALLAALAPPALAGDEAAARTFQAVVVDLLHAAGARDKATGDAQERAGKDLDFALELADALADALQIDSRGAAALAFASGLVRAPCREFVLEGQKPVRAWAEGEERPACGFGCPAPVVEGGEVKDPGYCAARGVTPEVARAVRDWRLCGGAMRTALPRAGGLEDQDAATISRFAQLDGLARTVSLRHEQD